MTKIIDFARQKGGNFPAKMFKKLIFPLSCAILPVKGGSALNILDLDTPQATEKYFAPQTDSEEPFFIPEYGCTFSGTPCYQLRLQSPVGCVQYVTAGAGILICNDRLYTVGAGDVFLLPEGSNQIYYSNPDNRFARQWLNFRGVLAKALLSVYDLADTVVFRKVDAAPFFAEIQARCRALTDPADYKREGAVLFLRLVQFLAEHKQPGEAVTGAVEQIRLFIDCHLTENLRIADIAAHFSFSGEHLIRLFKGTYGITPHQYILQSKMRLAMVLLKTTDESIEEIAEKLGFSDAHHFSTQFKRLLSYQPSQYRGIDRKQGARYNEKEPARKDETV